MYSLKEVNPRVKGIRDSPQGTLQRRTAEITAKLQQGVQKSFKEVIDVSSGDAHRAGIKPISFVRQVLAVCLYPELLHSDSLPLDVRHRAQRLLQECDGGSVGSYTDSCGLPHVQHSIAKFITERDGGVPAYAQNVFISAGSQKALMVVLKLLVRGEGVSQTGVLTPQPCPHTLPMLLEETGAYMVPYQLREELGWALELEELHRVLNTSKGHCCPRALYISNPGNPTGHVQSRMSIEEVIQFAAKERLFLLVDEVYQASVYGEDREFVSYKKVLFEMGHQYSNTVELASFHSISNAITGECGLRAGYMELVNLDPAVMLFAETLLCADISTPVTGQIALELMVNPPMPGDSSYGKYTQEILSNRITLGQNAQRACEFLNGLQGMSCQPVMGGVFAYPQLSLPPGAVEQAKMLGEAAVMLYCQRLLEEEGVCVGAGCEHGQRECNYLRLCVLTPSDVLEEVLARLGSFHLRFLDKFSHHAQCHLKDSDLD